MCSRWVCIYPNSDYYQSYAEAYADESKQAYDDSNVGDEQVPGFFSVMMRVLDEPGESVLAARQHSIYDINLDSYCTRHMTPCFSLENAEAYEVNIVVGNKETLQSTHKGVMRLGNIAFQDVLFVPGLLQTLISEAQLEKRGCKIVSEHGIRTVSKQGVYLFHATLEYNSYIFWPNLLPMSSRLLGSDEIVLAATVVPSSYQC